MRIRALAVLLASAWLGGTSAAGAQDLPVDQIKLPPGFRIRLYARNVPGARSLTLSSSGTVFVGSRGAGKVYALLDKDRDGGAEEVVTVLQDMDTPNGVAFKDGDLYVAQIGRVLRFRGIESRLKDPPAPEVVYDKLPTDRHHGWKFIRFGPDGRLYVPVGAPCNICGPGDPYAAIHRLRPDGSGLDVFARGVRNTVGFDWHPVTQELWFTDNGRDWLTDDQPPDELNHAPRPGLHFGYPHCHGKSILDPEFGRPGDCARFTPPAQELGPHVASLGMRFYAGRMFPAPYRNQIFIAEHGSWNRTTPIGYRVSLVRLEGSRAVEYIPFAHGWLQGRAAWGRPVDVQELADGSLLVSDDRAGAVYRITYRP